MLLVLRQGAPLQRAGWAWRVPPGPYAQPRRWRWVRRLARVHWCLPWLLRQREVLRVLMPMPLWVPKQAQLLVQVLGLGWRLGLGPRPQDA